MKSFKLKLVKNEHYNEVFKDLKRGYLKASDLVGYLLLNYKNVDISAEKRHLSIKELALKDLTYNKKNITNYLIDSEISTIYIDTK